ncbi:aldo/keto reductase [Egibacter rhizosphaerae]|uniref:aldo/keto reductase n=1 Tax=Egibacter rhizosphaerae TaxID=1670831 RepID=UPI003B832324
MPRIRVGASELPATPLGIGLAAVGRPAYLTIGHAEDLGQARGVADLERRSHEVLDAALEAGLRYVDAARSYGRAEAFLASWLDRRGADADGVTIASKWGYAYTGGWRMDASTHEVKDHSAAALRRQIGETRAVLGDRLDVYQIHSATLDTGVLSDPEVLDLLADLAAEGVRVGFTTSGPQQADVVRAALAALDRCPFAVVQATWNPLEPSAAPALAEAHDAGLVVVVKEALANGRLAPGGDAATGLLSCAGAGAEPPTADALALALALAQPWSDIVLSGAATPGQVAANARAVGLASAVSTGAVTELAEDPSAYWGQRKALPWR